MTLCYWLKINSLCFAIFCQKITRELLVLVCQVILTPSWESIMVGQTTAATSQVRDYGNNTRCPMFHIKLLQLQSCSVLWCFCVVRVQQMQRCNGLVVVWVQLQTDENFCFVFLGLCRRLLPNTNRLLWSGWAIRWSENLEELSPVFLWRQYYIITVHSKYDSTFSTVLKIKQNIQYSKINFTN